MNPSLSPYTSAVSLRSRRYRTLAGALLAVILMMSIYGGFVVMPKVRQAVDRPDTPALTRMATQPGPEVTAKQIAHAKYVLKARRVTVSLALAYWGVCSLFLVAVLFLAWLDFRESARSFVQQARTLRQDTVGSLRRNASSAEEDDDEED